MKTTIVSLLVGLVAAFMFVPAPVAEAATYPHCSNVWVVGKTLPKTYKGCRADGTIYVLVSVDCKEGPDLTQRGKKYARLGRVIKKGNYSAAYWKCVG